EQLRRQYEAQPPLDRLAPMLRAQALADDVHHGVIAPHPYVLYAALRDLHFALSLADGRVPPEREVPRYRHGRLAATFHPLLDLLAKNVRLEPSRVIANVAP